MNHQAKYLRQKLFCLNHPNTHTQWPSALPGLQRVVRNNAVNHAWVPAERSAGMFSTTCRWHSRSRITTAVAFFTPCLYHLMRYRCSLLSTRQPKPASLRAATSDSVLRGERLWLKLSTRKCTQVVLYSAPQCYGEIKAVRRISFQGGG